MYVCTTPEYEHAYTRDFWLQDATGKADCSVTAEETDEAECHEEKEAGKIHDGCSLFAY